jgi:hypothetical protein
MPSPLLIRCIKIHLTQFPDFICELIDSMLVLDESEIFKTGAHFP